MTPEELFKESQARKRERAQTVAQTQRFLERATPEEAREVAEDLAAYEALVEADPLQEFEAHSVQQMAFLAADTPVQAAFAGNRFGKCLHEDEMVRMADGTTKPIRDVKVGDYVVGVDMQGKTKPARVTAHFDQGVKDVYEHRFSKRGSGDVSFRATLDHKMLARPEGREFRVIPAGELKRRWVTTRAHGFDAQTEGRDEEYALFFGLMLGDGCTTRGTVQFTSADDDVTDLMRTAVAPFGHKLWQNKSNPIQFYATRTRVPVGAGTLFGCYETDHPALIHKLREHGMACYAHEKRIPDVCWSWSNDALARLVAGLYLTDGSVCDTDCNPTLQFVSTSRDLVEGLYRILQERFGVYGAAIHRQEREGKPGHNRRPEYSFAIGNYGSLKRFHDAIPLIGRKGEKLRTAIVEWKGKRSDGANLIWRSREYVGKAQTYDITVDNDTHLFALANGLVVSNTVALVVKCLIQHRGDLLPKHLRRFKAATGHPVAGRLLVPSEKAFEEYTKPAFKKWTPKDMFLGGSWEKAWDGKYNVLRFSGDQGQIGIYTYKQDPATMVGADLDYVAYDEPPPQEIRNESLIRLVDRDGFEMFAMTPVNMTGGGIGWIWREIWKKRDDGNTTVIKASIWDNPLHNRQTIERVLAQFPEEERAAREKGDFVHFGGMVYAGGFEDVLVDPPSPERVRSLDNVVGIDPGLRNAAFTWHGFDEDNRVLVYDEVLLKEGNAADYVLAICRTNAKWGLPNGDLEFYASEILKKRHQEGALSEADYTSQLRQIKSHGRGYPPTYVIDPSARNRQITGGDSIESELQRLGLYTQRGNNDVQAGVSQIRLRKQQGGFFVSKDCKKLRSEAEEYRQEDRPDGDFKVVKENDHLLDSDRYACASRPWFPLLPEQHKRTRKPFEFRDGTMHVNGHLPEPQPEAPPLGAMS